MAGPASDVPHRAVAADAAGEAIEQLPIERLATELVTDATNVLVGHLVVARLQVVEARARRGANVMAAGHPQKIPVGSASTSSSSFARLEDAGHA